MPSNTATFDMKDIAREGEFTLTVHLARVKRFRWRVKIAGWLIRLASWVMWSRCELEVEQ